MISDDADALLSHVLLTRFNLATPGRELSIRLKSGWLEHRFRLFERYCLPGMAAQRRGPDAWLVFFDGKTLAAFRERIEERRRQIPFTPVYTHLSDGGGVREASAVGRTAENVTLGQFRNGLDPLLRLARR